MDPSPDAWRRCSTCKKPLAFKTRYWVCNVSTCNRKRTGLVFCSVACWDAHVPVMNHRDAWALEKVSPTRDEWAREQAAEAAGGAASSSSRDGSRAGGSRPSSSPPSHPRDPVPPVATARFQPAAILRRSSSGAPDPTPANASAAQPGQAGSSERPLERRIDVPRRSPSTSAPEDDMTETHEEAEDILVVASKLKQYIRNRSGMNTSAAVLEALSDRLRELCDEAIEVARQDGRKTVLDRDFKR